MRWGSAGPPEALPDHVGPGGGGVHRAQTPRRGLPVHLREVPRESGAGRTGASITVCNVVCCVVQSNTLPLKAMWLSLRGILVGWYILVLLSVVFICIDPEPRFRWKL